ncbi:MULTISPECIES: arsenate reductase (glutaredoxin) [Reichenbachiella]|uniref:Arsenate reductase n=1 Tax=Reichenbachiella agariperforans TaxID=156994 RepID=A0A1M6WKP4_REIAG|nr:MULTISPECIES: arsenate reductase (glutaredoxin) [Reichenbachiella]MBU2912501.1 arsenate reductase (glutaredoxin) [Reichenbachiella agariperforans]RJE72637.1 arsenate reductase (glutaredoxin) [Reichenbachiella sp. MSK19-1]SHK94095.1 arsenate reductase [Reichenbachiella agariperforans]
MTKIYHNPRCQKSRNTLSILEERQEDLEIIEYLKTPPTHAELSEIISMLGIKAEDLLRKGESIYKEQYKKQRHSDPEWIDIMVANPKLIERPIIIKNGKAVIGRPPEKVLEII